MWTHSVLLNGIKTNWCEILWKEDTIKSYLGGYIALLYNRTSCFTIRVNQLSVKYEYCSKRNTPRAFQKSISANTLCWNLTSTGIGCGRNPFTLACLCLLLQVLINPSTNNVHDHFVLKLSLLGSVLVQIHL